MIEEPNPPVKEVLEKLCDIDLMLVKKAREIGEIRKRFDSGSLTMKDMRDIKNLYNQYLHEPQRG